MENHFLSFDSKPFGLTIFLAIVTFQIAYILFQWYYIRRSDYLYYIAYMFAIMVFALSQFEYLLPFKLLSQYSPDMEYYTRHSLPFFSIFLYYRFARSFLDLPIERPSLNKWVIRLEYLIIAYAVLSPLLIAAGIPPEVEDNLFLFVCSIVIISSGVIIYNFLQRSIPLFRFAMTGAVFLILGSIAMIILSKMEELGIDTGVDPFLPLLVCVIAELLTFTTGLSYKTHLMESEKLNVERKLLDEFREKQRLEKEMYAIRDNIARDLHDEIGSGLSKISLLGEVIKKESKVPEPRIDKIIGSAKEMIEGMGEMVWSLNSKNDSLSNLIYYLRRYSMQYFEDSNIEIKFNVESNIPDIPVSSIKRRNLLMVYKETLNNILKHSKATVTIISMAISNNELLIIIHDNGKGFVLNEDDTAGNGLINMQSRMTEISGNVSWKNEGGVIVKMRMPLEYPPFGVT